MYLFERNRLNCSTEDMNSDRCREKLQETDDQASEIINGQSEDCVALWIIYSWAGKRWHFVWGFSKSFSQWSFASGLHFWKHTAYC